MAAQQNNEYAQDQDSDDYTDDQDQPSAQNLHEYHENEEMSPPNSDSNAGGVQFIDDTGDNQYQFDQQQHQDSPQFEQDKESDHNYQNRLDLDNQPEESDDYSDEYRQQPDNQQQPSEDQDEPPSQSDKGNKKYEKKFSENLIGLDSDEESEVRQTDNIPESSKRSKKQSGFDNSKQTTPQNDEFYDAEEGYQGE